MTSCLLVPGASSPIWEELRGNRSGLWPGRRRYLIRGRGGAQGRRRSGTISSGDGAFCKVKICSPSNQDWYDFICWLSSLSTFLWRLRVK